MKAHRRRLPDPPRPPFRQAPDLGGDVRPGDLERLAESLAGPDGELRYRITATLDPPASPGRVVYNRGLRFSHVPDSLEAFRHDLAINDRLVLVDSEASLPPIDEESEAEDYLVADEPLDIRELVEDAVLLALPMVPRKPGLEEAPAAGGEVGRATPFAALAGFKRRQ